MEPSSFTDPNKVLINDSRTLSALSLWESLANGWQWYELKGYLRCLLCNQAAYRIYDNNGTRYTIAEADILALKVAHLRQNHEKFGRNFI
jgi:hypothetical protein